MSTARILVAEDKKALPCVTKALAGYDLILPSSLKEAEEMILADGIDLFILGINFEDSRATELANTIRRSAAHAKTPIVLVRALPSTIAKFIRNSTNGLKASGVITDFLEFQNADEVLSSLRPAVEAYLTTGKIVSAGYSQ